MDGNKNFYVTTAIDYPNGKPHIGHVYEKIIADTYARWHHQRGQTTYFVTGTDDNGQKLVKSAGSVEKTQAFVDQNAQVFRDLVGRLNLQVDDFIRTSEPRHHKVAQDFWQKLEAKNLIFEDEYSAPYCYACENFYPEKDVCPEHHQPIAVKHEQGYFFRMSEFSDWILNHLKENPRFVFPEGATKELIGRLEADPLKDLSITRENQGWGVVAPGTDEKYVMYTWFDAVINYYSALDSKDKLAEFWPASMHVIGKDIVWFHGVIWPIMLHALDLELPETVFVHGMLLGADGRKMSKSLGNTVDVDEVLKALPLDSLRYYLMRYIPSGGDGKFDVEEVKAKLNSELANDWGNLLSRTVKLTIKRFGESIDVSDSKPIEGLAELQNEVEQMMTGCLHQKALDSIWAYINQLNAYLNTEEPWRDKTDQALEPLKRVLLSLAAVNELLKAFLPESSVKVEGYLGAKGQAFELNSPDPLFAKMT